MLENGQIFDTNVGKKKSALKFKVGMGKVIRGWDEAVLEMSKGEKAKITIEPDWAYGAKGTTAQPHDTQPHTHTHTQATADRVDSSCRRRCCCRRAWHHSSQLDAHFRGGAGGHRYVARAHCRTSEEKLVNPQRAA